MTDIFLRIQEQLKKQYPFAVYSKPGSDTITGIFQNDAAVHHANSFSGKGFVFAPFGSGSPVLIPAEDSDILVATADPVEVTPPEPKTSVIDSEAKAAFEELVKQCTTAINAGEFEKLVASRAEDTPLRSEDFSLIYRRLFSTYPNAFRYCFYTRETGLWMGATPEQILKVQGNKLHTVALAGTQVHTGAQKVSWGDKEKQEQQFVTDYIISSLQGITTDIRTTEPYTFRAGNLLHIKTDISAELKSGTGLSEAISALHPTPAVCGLPKDKARDFLLQHEGYDREYYAGYLGEINRDFALGTDGQSDLFVNLRCMKLTGATARLFIGCGITKDSDPEKEFIETVNKSLTMKRVL